MQAFQNSHSPQGLHIAEARKGKLFCSRCLCCLLSCSAAFFDGLEQIYLLVPIVVTPTIIAAGGEERSIGETEPLGDHVSDISNPEDLQAPEDSDVKFALKALQWYKSKVSPLLPNSCRFLPTCSSYSVQAYKKYGYVKGTILTAWRLIRCNPLNLRVQYQGKYDPPTWPPVGLEWALQMF